jgi:anti-anti-sigma factor
MTAGLDREAHTQMPLRFVGKESWKEAARMNVAGQKEKAVVEVTLACEPQMREDLAILVEEMNRNGMSDIALDFSQVDIITSASLASLIRLREMAGAHGRDLVFRNVSAATKGIFEVTELSRLFAIEEDE